jgi:hypothetical protein
LAAVEGAFAAADVVGTVVEVDVVVVVDTNDVTYSGVYIVEQCVQRMNGRMDAA